MAPFGASRAGLMSVAEDDIPDTAVAYLSTQDTETVSESSGTFTVEDQAGGATVTGPATDYDADGINDNPALRFNADDVGPLSGSFNETLTDRLVVMMVLDVDNEEVGGGHVSLASAENPGSDDVIYQMASAGFPGEYDIQHSGAGRITGNQNTFEPELLTVDVNGTSSAVRRNGSEILTGELNETGWNDLFIFLNDDLKGYWGHLEIHDPAPDNINERESDLMSLWGISS